MKKPFIFIIGILLIAINTEAASIEKMAKVMTKDFKDAQAYQLAIMHVELGEGLISEDSLMIYNKLFKAFAGISGVSLIERSQLDKVFNEIKFQASGAVNSTDTIKIGALSKANLLLLSTANKTDRRRIEINARIVEASSAKVLSADKCEITMDWGQEREEKAKKSESERIQFIKDIKKWDIVIANYPPTANYYYQRGLCYFNIQDYGSAIRDFSSADKIGNLDYPELPLNYFLLGSAYYRLGDYDNAIEPFKKVITLNSDKEGKQGAYSLLIKCLRRTNKDAEVIPWATEAIKMFSDAEIYRIRGYSRFKLGENNLALIDYQRAKELSAGNSTTNGLIAWVYYDMGRYDSALELFANLLASDKSADGFIGVALSQFRLGNIDKAKTNYYEAIKLDGRFAGYFDSLAPDYYYTPIELKALRELYDLLNSPRLSEILETHK